MLKSSFRLSLALVAALAGCTAQIADEPADTTQTTEELRVVANKNARIAIVGAGPSGLTAADTLRKRGYKNVTVFEREAQVGGKVRSVNVQGTMTELGAVFASPDYKLVLEYAKKYGIPTETYNTTRYIIDENGRQTNESFLTSRYTPEEIKNGGTEYIKTMLLYLQTNLNGFALYSADLKLPFQEFAEKYKITPITDLMRSVMVGFGYPYYEDAPTMYYMKLITWLLKFDPAGLLTEQPLVPAEYFTFPTGFQSVWTALANDGLNVKLNSTVTNIERKPDNTLFKTGKGTIVLTINGKTTHEFDEVIISAPLNRVADFMELSGKESELFQYVESERYVVTLFASANLPRGEVAFFDKNSYAERINHVVAWGSRDSSPANIAYQIADRSSSLTDIENTLKADVAEQGGVYLTKIGDPAVGFPGFKEWPDYFPHVRFHATGEEGEKVAPANFYDQVELMQGDNHTFYVGGTLSFETVEHSAAYAKQMVETHFF